ncbi:hypothetical protein O1L68_11050 [Streptomyces lydicus]|nr:hypothetical protein [Streptomyces lydicus]
MYTAAERVHLLDDTLELGLCAGGRRRCGCAAWRSAGRCWTPGPARCSPSSAPRCTPGSGRGRPGENAFGRRAGGFAIPLRAVAEAAPQGALAALLERNAVTVPAYGSELNPAGAQRLAELSTGSAERPRRRWEPVERPEAAAEFARFEEAHGTAAACVLGLVGQPGCGRSTELAGVAARRARGPAPAATIRLRGAELRPDDDGCVPPSNARCGPPAGVSPGGPYRR